MKLVLAAHKAKIEISSLVAKIMVGNMMWARTANPRKPKKTQHWDNVLKKSVQTYSTACKYCL